VNKVKKALTKTETQTTVETKNTDHLFLNIDKTLHKINFKDIIYIASDRNYVTIVTSHSKLCYIESLKSWMLQLPLDRFIQVHKSFIVNYNMIEKISGNQMMINGDKIPIGRSFKASLLRKINSNERG
jgi:DNA-binding LytR/AlgR family response regulator